MHLQTMNFMPRQSAVPGRVQKHDNLAGAEPVPSAANFKINRTKEHL